MGDEETDTFRQIELTTSKNSKMAAPIPEQPFFINE